MAKVFHKCVTPGCTGEIGAGSITGLCKRCYSSIYNWQKRPAKELENRVKRLRLYESRMNFILPKNKVRIRSAEETFVSLAVLPGRVKQYRKRSKYKVVKS